MTSQQQRRKGGRHTVGSQVLGRMTSKDSLWWLTQARANSRVRTTVRTTASGAATRLLSHFKFWWKSSQEPRGGTRMANNAANWNGGAISRKTTTSPFCKSVYPESTYEKKGQTNLGYWAVYRMTSPMPPLSLQGTIRGHGTVLGSRCLLQMFVTKEVKTHGS